MPLNAWFASSLERIFPATKRRSRSLPPTVVLRGGRTALQVCVRNDEPDVIEAKLSLHTAGPVHASARSVGLVPVPHHNTFTPAEYLDGMGHIPGWVPDPLLPEDRLLLGPYETRSFWVTLRAAGDAPLKPATLTARVTCGSGVTLEIRRRVTVDPYVVAPLNDFPVTHWFYGDAIADWYEAAPCTKRWWSLIEAYMADLTSHNNSCMYVPIFTPPTDGVKRPSQLLVVRTNGADAYSFDWSRVERWTGMARRAGARFFEWTHLFTQWGASNAIRIYRSNDDPGSLLWPPETPATSLVYRRFLGRFLPEFHNFLETHDLLPVSFFHLSDEPGPQHLANYRAARQMLRELAPWMRVMDAMSHVEFAAEGLTDTPVASIGAARNFRKAGIGAWAYFCCGPRGAYLNRLLDTPLPRIRMAGRLLHAMGARGFLHWGYNYWYRSQTQQLINPMEELAGGVWPDWPHGDPFVVYPGPNGPIDSIRWEVWAEALQDLAILRQQNVKADHPALAGIRDYCDFPPADERGSAGLVADLRGEASPGPASKLT